MLANLERSIAPELLDLYGLVAQFLLGTDTTLVYYNPASLDCSWSVLWRRHLTAHPQIVWQRGYPYPDLYERFNGAGLLVLACLSEDSSSMGQLENLASSLNHLRATVRLLIEVAGFDRENLASRLLSFCLRMSILQVELYFGNTNHSPLSLYSYHAFPQFELVKRGISQTEIFTNKLVDLRGHRLRVMPDLSPPNTFSYQDAKGKTKMAGYLWDFMATFASRLNASLAMVRPNFRAGGAPESSYMLQYTAQGLIDVGLTTTLITRRNSWAMRQYTYPILISSWCTMLPVERPLRTPDLFTRILCPALAVILLIVILITWLVFGHLSCLMLLKNSRMARIVPRLLALLLLTTSSSQLLSLLISPPFQERITSFEDLLQGDQRILGMRSEFYDFDGAFRARYAGIFYLIDDPDELYDLRNHFNTTWGYTMAYMKWLVINAQQRHFAKPVFRWAEDLCFVDFMPTSIVVAPDSIYWEALKDFSLSADRAGLLKHWVRKSFYDMVKAGRMSIKDYSELVTLKPLNVKDLELLWLISGGAIAVASGIFLMELFFFYVNVFLNSL